MGAGGPGAWRRRGWLRGPPRSDHHPESVSYCSGNGRGEARPTTPAQAPAPTGRVVSHGPGLTAPPPRTRTAGTHPTAPRSRLAPRRARVGVVLGDRESVV